MATPSKPCFAGTYELLVTNVKGTGVSASNEPGDNESRDYTAVLAVALDDDEFRRKSACFQLAVSKIENLDSNMQKNARHQILRGYIDVLGQTPSSRIPALLAPQ